MGWFKQIMRNVFQKQASAEDIKRKALDALQREVNPANPTQVANQFIMEMASEDPSFARSPFIAQLMGASKDQATISGLISSYVPSQPAASANQITQEDSTLAPPPSTFVEKPPVEKPPVEKVIDQQIEEPGVIDRTPEITTDVLENLNDEAVPEELSEKEEPLIPEGQEGFQSFEDRLKQDNEDLEEENEKSIYKDPTILRSFIIPVERIMDAAKSLEPINKSLRAMYHPEIKLEWEDGDNQFEKPVYYRDGSSAMESFARMKLSGMLPSPTDEIHIRNKVPAVWGRPKYDKPLGDPDRKIIHNVGDPVMEPDGITQKMITNPDKDQKTIPKGVRIFARINHHALTEEEIQLYLTTEPDGPNPGDKSPLRIAIESAIAENEVPFFNTITPIGKRYKWDDKFYFSKAQECFKCQARQPRNTTYIAAVVAPDQLKQKTYRGQDEQGNWVDLPLTVKRDLNYDPNNPNFQDVPALEIPEDILSDPDLHDQQQLGGNCAESYAEIDLIPKIEKLIKGWEKTSQEIEENDIENAKEGEAPKERQNKPGGTRGYVPAEKFFTTAIAMLREEGLDSDISGRLPYATSNYVDLIEMQAKDIKKMSPLQQKRYQRAIERKKELIPKITLEDQKIATEAANWWRQKLNGYGTDEHDKNKVALSILTTMDIRHKKRRTKSNPDGVNPNLQYGVEMMQAYLDSNDITLEPYPEEIQPEIQPEVGEDIVDPSLGANRGIGDAKPEDDFIDNMRTVRKGNSFVSKFTHISSNPYAGGHGMLHYFRGNDGKKYKIFDTFQKDPETNQLIREPKFTFEEGEEYTLRGTKGKYSGGSTAMGNVSEVAPERLADHVGTDVPEATVEPEITPEAPIDDIKPEITPEDTINPEVPGKIPAAPPIDEAPKPKAKGTLPQITERAKSVVTTGRDSRGNPMPVKTLIPLYVKSLENLVPNLNTKEYSDNCNAVYQRSGRDALAKYMDTIENTLKIYVRKPL